MSATGKRKCACCRHMYTPTDSGTFPEHRRSLTVMGDQRRCPGSNRTPEVARQIEREQWVARELRKRGES